MLAPFPWTERETYKLAGKTYTVHSVARLFPLIEGAEFTRLVDDVRTHGVREPILVTGPDDSVIVDGRNRARAAKAAGVVPDFKELPADADPVAVIVSANVCRRNMKKGQVAMIGALLRTGLPIGDPAVADWLAATEGVGDGAGVGEAAMWRELTQEHVAARLGISVAYLGRAERVLREAPNLVMQVLYGAIELNAAVEKCEKPVPPVEDVRQTAPASGETSGDRTDERPQSLRPSDKRHTTVAGVGGWRREPAGRGSSIYARGRRVRPDAGPVRRRVIPAGSHPDGERNGAVVRGAGAGAETDDATSPSGLLAGDARRHRSGSVFE